MQHHKSVFQLFFEYPRKFLGARLRKNTRNDPQFFVFMLTEKDSAKIRYGICLNFYQSFDRRSTPHDEKKVQDDSHWKKYKVDQSNQNE